MCVAELNVSLLSCRHRWYHLSRSCSPTSNLSNCSKRLGLTGWEIKCDFCPYCAGWNLSHSEYRLVGNDRAPALGGLSQSPSISLTTTRRESRRQTLTLPDSNSISILAQKKNNALNARVDAYLKASTEPSIPSPFPAPLRDEVEDDPLALANSPSDASSDGYDSVRHSSTSSTQSDVPRSIFTKWRRRSKRLSMTLFK